VTKIQKKLYPKWFGIALLLYAMTVAPVASACSILALKANQYLDRGRSISYDGMTIVHQYDGNVVSYVDGRPVWSTNTYGNSTTTRLVMQGDGNLVLYGLGSVVWASNTNNTPFNFFGMHRRCPGVTPTVGMGTNIQNTYNFQIIFAYF
jgi:hypothetical protein